MVSYRGSGQSMSHPMSLSHGASHHHHHHHPTPHNGVTLRPNVNMQGPSINLSSQVHSNHSANANNLNISTLNGMPSHMLSSQSGLGAVKHESSQSSHYTNMNCLMPSHHFRLVQQQGPIRHPRAPTPQRADGFHVSGSATTGGYMGGGNTTGGSAQSSLRGVPPSATQPPTPPQQTDLSKQTMAGHGYVQQQQAPPPQQRPQIQSYQSYRTPQTSNRPTPISRQQTPSIYPNAGSGSSQLMYGSVMGPGFLIPPTSHMSLAPTQYPQQQRPPQPYFQQNTAMGPIPIAQQHFPFGGYGNQQASGPYLYTTGSPQMAMSMAGPPISSRTGGTTMGPPPNGPPGPPSVSAANNVQQQNSSHSYMHANLPALAHQAPMHGNLSNKKAPRQHAIPVVHPDTGQNVMDDYFTENQATSGESSERQTPQPETTSSISVVEEFIRVVNEKAKESDTQPDLPVKSPEINTNVAKGSNNKQSNINTNSTSSIKINALPSPTEQKISVTELVIEPEDTPVVSAISNSPEIVPKICLNSNKPQKSPEHNVSPTHVDGNKNQAKLQKQVKQKPQLGVEDNKNNNEYPPTMPPQPQRVKKYGSEPRSNRVDASPLKSEEKDSPVVVISSNPNGPEPTDTVSDPKDSTPKTIVDKPKEDNLENVISTEQELTIASSETAVIEVAQQPEIRDTPKEILLDTQVEQLESLDQPHLESNATEAQAKLNQSIASCNKISNQTGSKMKDINHANNKTLAVEGDANCNSNNSQQSKSQPSANNIKNESLQSEQKVKTASLDVNLNESGTVIPQTNMEETEISKDETDKAMVNEVMKYYKDDLKIETYEAVNDKPAVPVLKYNYKDDQWSPVNTSGKKCYDKDFLLQLQDDPKSKQKPENISSILSVVIKTKVASGEGVHNFSNIAKNHGDTFLPTFAKNSSQRGGGVMRGDAKKNILQGKSSAKGGGGSGMNKPNVIHVSLSLREDVKLNETENAWKPSRLKQASYTADEQKTQDLYKKVRGVLNKLTPQKFDTLIEQVKELEIDNETRLEGVIELVFEKAIDEPNFSVAYALMCKQLALLKVPASNPEDEYVNFRKLILTRCQKQFLRKNDQGPRTVTEKDIAECTDPMKRKELQAIYEEEERRIRMRSVGNVRFIGELFKQQMLTVKIMMHCIKILLDGCEDEQLECLCKLLTTIGKELDSNENNAREVQDAFKKMQALVDRKTNKLNSRIRFMLQDVIELRKRNWVLRHNDVNPKTIDQIQKEADMEQMQIQMMNSGPISVRKDEGSRSGKRGGGRSGSSSAAEEGWSSIPNKQRPLDTNKLRFMQNKEVNQITLGPPVNLWHRGSGAKGANQPSSNSMSAIGTTTSTNNMYGPLENLTDSIPSNTRGGPKDPSTGYHSKGGSIERSTFKPSFASTGITTNRSGSVGGSRSNSSTRKNPPASSLGPSSITSAVPLTVAAPSASTDDKVTTDIQLVKTVQKMMDTYYIGQIFDEFEMDVKQKFSCGHHPYIIRAIFNVLIEMPAKKHQLMVDVVLNLVTKNIISPENFVNGIDNFLTNLDPDIVVDVPKVYDYVAFFVTPHIIHQTLTLPQLLKCSAKVIEENKGGTLIREVLKLLIDSMGPNFVKAKWHESGMSLKAWMHEEQINDFKVNNKLEFLDDLSAVVENTNKVCLSPEEARKKILHLMQTEQSWDCINAWIQDNIGAAVKEGWFIRVLFQAMCEFSLLHPDGRTIRFDKERMNKYVQMITEFGDSKESRESNCLFGIQLLVHRLEHPQGVTLELFQYLSNEYIISPDGFLAWEKSELEPEGKGVMLKALVSFFTELREGDNEDSCGED